ncbi:Adaptor for signal transduction [Entophlyctis sp. JEL0112]|nr:Adaptor for signal transduction [Entophlyctis sp. JEL0112]
MDSWDAAQVASFVAARGFPSLERVFRENNISGPLLLAADHQMLTQLGLSLVGQRIELLAAIAAEHEKLSVYHSSAAPKPPSTEALLDQMAAEIVKLRDEILNLRSDLSVVWSIASDQKSRSTSEAKFQKFPVLKSSMTSVDSARNLEGSPALQIANTYEPAKVGTIRVCLDNILAASPSSVTATTPSRILPSTSSEPVNKAFRVSDSDDCAKIIAGVLKKFRLVDGWRSFYLTVRVTGQEEQRLHHDDHPLVIQSVKRAENSDASVLFVIHRKQTVQEETAGGDSPATTRSRKLPTTPTSGVFPFSSNPAPGVPATPAPAQRLPGKTQQNISEQQFNEIMIDDDVTSNQSDENQLVAFYNFRATRADELNVAMGDRFRLLRRERNRMCVQSIDDPDGRTGWVPSGCLKPLMRVAVTGPSQGPNESRTVDPNVPNDSASAAAAVTPAMVIHRPGIPPDALLPVLAIAVYEFDGANVPDALPVRAGTQVVVHKKEGSWVYVKTGDRRGWVPDSYVSMLREQDRSLTEHRSNPLTKISSMLDDIAKAVNNANDDGIVDPSTSVAPSSKSQSQTTSNNSTKGDDKLSALIESVKMELAQWIEAEETIQKKQPATRSEGEDVLEGLTKAMQLVNLVHSSVTATGPVDAVGRLRHEEIVGHLERVDDACRKGSIAAAGEGFKAVGNSAVVGGGDSRGILEVEKGVNTGEDSGSKQTPARSFMSQPSDDRVSGRGRGRAVVTVLAGLDAAIRLLSSERK